MGSGETIAMMLDGRTIIERGRIVDPKMVVQREMR
jgi:hypothetical protein